MTAAAFVVPRASAPSGGHAYNAAVVTHWPGTPPAVVQLDGPWPRGDQDSLAQLREALREPELALVDGLVGAAHPDLLIEATAGGCRIVLLIHLPLADEGGLSQRERDELAQRECRSVSNAWRVVTTSRTAADGLSRTCGRDDIVAVPPGVDPAPLAEPHHPPGLLQVGSIGPRKNQLASLAALAGCAEFDWTATFVGPVADETYAARFRAALSGARAVWTGPLDAAALNAHYEQADLLLHPARAETWGMVVTEALARGIPAIVGAGTGAVEALGSGASPGLPGAVVEVDEPDALTHILGRWLGEPGLRDEWRRNARRARAGLWGWPEAAAELARVVEQA